MPSKQIPARDWQALLQQSIPLARAMHVSTILEADGRVRLIAPLAPNVNDKGTAFGGSLATLGTLAGWVETQRQLDLAGVDGEVEIVIQHGETDYLLPVTADFSALVLGQDAEALQRFLRLFLRRGLARLTVAVEISCAGLAVARFTADYVAKRCATR